MIVVNEIGEFKKKQNIIAESFASNTNTKMDVLDVCPTRRGRGYIQ